MKSDDDLKICIWLIVTWIETNLIFLFYWKGTRTYYNRLDVVVLEKTEVESVNNNSSNIASSLDGVTDDEENFVYNTQTVLIKCQFANLTAFNHNNRIRRDVLPAGFQEAE